MSIQIDLKSKTIQLGVGDLVAEETARVGQLGGVALYARMAMGRRAHDRHQQAQGELVAGYRREIAVKHSLTVDGFDVRIQGRLDGVYERGGCATVEEVKTVVCRPGQFAQLEAGHYPTYCAQLRVYCYLLQRAGYEEVVGRLLFINVTDQTQRVLEVPWTVGEVETFIVHRVRALIAAEEAAALRRQQRQRISPALRFPFPAPRPHQDRLMEAVGEALASGRHLLVSAPSGIGKTVGALYPVLRHALAHDRTVFFVTAKTTQQDIVWETLQRIREGGESCTAITALRLRAKEKMCLNDIYACHEDFCQYLRDFDSKLELSQVVARLRDRRQVDPDWLLQQGRAARLCPFELALIAGREADVHVCDYNYVFDPAVSLRHFFQENRHRDKILILDEAHNLYGRALEYYSPTLRRRELRRLLESLPSDPALAADLGKWLRALDAVFRQLARPGGDEMTEASHWEMRLTAEVFERLRERLEPLMIRYQLHRLLNRIAAASDPFQEFFSAFLRFYQVLELGGEEFSHLFARTAEGQQIQILCKCPARQLRARLNGFHSVIAMSATLDPPGFYRDVLGFDAERTDLLTLPSPFPSRHRKIVVIPTLSTTYRQRARSHVTLAHIISRIVRIREGNYAVFFPSFEYLRAVEPLLGAAGLPLLVQERQMEAERRDQLLAVLRSERGRVILAVQGGLFAEGVDFPGEQLIGVIVVSPGLPTVSVERELMRRYYEERYDGQGFEYAYLYPGMARVIQSVGRLIRTETDRGIAVLICQRFATPQYSRLFPRHWYEHRVEELWPRDWEGALAAFWGATNGGHKPS